MRKFGRAAAVLTAIALVCGTAMPAYAQQPETFFRLDAGYKKPGKPLKNLRFLKEGEYQLSPVSKKNKIDPFFMPSTAGMDQLHISGSEQYSEEQFRELAGQLREMAGDDPVYIIDLRQESHGFLNGIPVSWYGNDNEQNIGMNLAEVEADEQQRFGSLPGTTITAYSAGSKKARSMDIPVETWMTEKELAESEGFGYLRLPATDHEWADPELIDEFIAFVKTLDTDHVWLHFHCQAGMGRTGTFMCIYDMMKNPDVPLEDIVLRQAMTGSSYLLYPGIPGEKKREKYRTKSENIRLVYEYIQENRESDYEVTWSEWLSAHNTQAAA